jgi:hypothetical protein
LTIRECCRGIGCTRSAVTFEVFHGVRVNEQVADRVSVRSRRARRSVRRLSLGHNSAADPIAADARPVQGDFTIAIRSDSHIETLPFYLDVGRSASCKGRSRP